MVASADIGLVLYKQVPKVGSCKKYRAYRTGFREIFPSHEAWFAGQQCQAEMLLRIAKKYRFGIDIEDFSLMGDAIAKIFKIMNYIENGPIDFSWKNWILRQTGSRLRKGLPRYYHNINVETRRIFGKLY